LREYMKLSVIVLALVTLLLVGCSNPQTRAAEAAEQVVTANTPTSQPTATASPTLTSSPTSIPTATATSTSTPTPTSIPTEMATSTSTPTRTRILAATHAPSTTPTSTPIPANTPIPTATPPGGFPQLCVGLAPGALRVDGCGGVTFWSMDHDSTDGSALSFWDKYPDIPKPQYSHRTKDGRRILDICTHVDYEIWWAMEEGKVTESRPGVLTILITTGYGAGLRLTIQHCAIAEGIAVGSVVKYGDTIAWTARELMPPITQTDASPTAVGVFGRTGSYHPDQEMMIIGLDGEPNILYEK